MEIKESSILITIKNRPYLIAEAGVAHFGSFEKALELFKMSKDANCDAFKIQAFDADTLYANEANGWKERLRDRVLSIDEIKKLSDLCIKNKIDFIITPHDASILPYLDQIDIKAIKIGSGEAGNYDFIEDCFEFTDQLIYSTGLSTIEDIDKVNKIAINKGKNLSILHCNTSYPTDDTDVNLSVIGKFNSLYPNCTIGYSDHTPDHFACISAIAAGAKIIERHITLEKNIPNAQDWKVSSLPSELKILRQDLDRAYTQFGNEEKYITNAAKKNIFWACKSPYACANLNEGEIINKDSYEMKRPFTGTKLEDIKKHENIGILNKNIKYGEKITLEDFL